MTRAKPSPSTSTRPRAKPKEHPSIFSGLPDYPGKRVPVNRKESQPEDEEWSARPTQYPVNGEVRDFYTIAHVAQALNKSPVTIRSWEKKGLLPTSSLRSPRPVRAPIAGTQPRGRRLWTREQIEAILQIAKEEKCILNGEPPTQKFTKRVTQKFTKLNAQFTKDTKRHAQR